MKKKEYFLEIGGKKLTAEFSDLAEQANGSVVMRYGNTAVLVTAVMSKGEKTGVDFFPLTVDYEERFYAGGKILGSRFVRREGRPTDEAILSGRIVDRTIRPLFEQHLRYEVQVVITVLSIDEDDPDILAVLGASLAIGTSDIPWNGPVSAIRIAETAEQGGKKEDAFVVNPTYLVRENAKLDLVACGKDGNINMIEVGGKETDEATLVSALKKSAEEIERLQEFQEKIIKELGKPKKEVPAPAMPKEVTALFKENIEGEMSDHVMSGKPGHAAIYKIKGQWMELLKEKLPEVNESFGDSIFENKVNEIIHREAIENDRRPDNRKMEELRPLFAKAGGVSPILHGSGIFYRGGTHILSALTLGGPGDSQVIDGMELQTKKRFMHHYNFPPFSSGEVGRMGGTNRRMVGHGALAEKALLPVLPPKETFPYTIRIVSEALEYGDSSVRETIAVHLALHSLPIFQWGTEEQKQRF
ncbi:MAG: acyl-CoA dehydrogenase family protein [Candidatus Taylorbacteria bacterium]|nr:acyl-CoA dehydrogenase family protein [Candidatus Taylorbacteria bacterium]